MGCNSYLPRKSSLWSYKNTKAKPLSVRDRDKLGKSYYSFAKNRPMRVVYVVICEFLLQSNHLIQSLCVLI